MQSGVSFDNPSRKPQGGRASPSPRPTHSWRRALEMDCVHTPEVTDG